MNILDINNENGNPVFDSSEEDIDNFQFRQFDFGQDDDVCLFDVNTEYGQLVFDESVAREERAIHVNCNIDNGAFDQESVTVLDPLGNQPEIFFQRRLAPNSATGGLWRHFAVTVENAAGTRPIFKVSRQYRDGRTTLNLGLWKGVYTQDFSNWVQSEQPVLEGGNDGTFNWQFTSVLPAGLVYVAHNIYGRQEEADALAQYLLVDRASVASPADPSYTGGIYARSIVENGDLGQPVGDHPRYAIKLAWPESTTDGKRKRKLVVMYGIHSAGEGQAWWPFSTSIKWLIDSSDLAAQNLRANWDVYLYFNVNPNGIKAGTSRVTPRNNNDPNRNWSGLGSVSSLEEVDTLKRVIYANVDGHCDAFYSWHGDVYSTSNFQTWVWTPDYNAGTRGIAMQAMLTAGAAIWGIPATLSTSNTNNTDVWFGRSVLKSTVAFDTENPSMSGSSVAYFEQIGRNWMQTLEVVDQAGQILRTETIPAIPAIIGLTGVSASIRDTLTVLANPAIIGLSGVRANVRFSESIHANPAIIGLSGVHASVNVSWSVTISAIPAIIGLQGVPASLRITGSISIPANPAIISLSGVNAGIDLDSGSVNFGTANTSRYFLSDAMADMDLSGDFSIVAVISPDYTVSNRHKYFFSTGAANDPAGLNLYITSNNGLLSLLPGNGAGAVSSAAVPPRFCLVYGRRISGVVSVGFVDLSNGTHIKSNTSSSSANFSNDVAVIGGRFDLDAMRFFTGGMSWIALLEAGLSDSQIESIAAGTTGLLNEFEPSVVELWDMTYNRLIQPGVVHGINAQRFGGDWGAGGGNPLPYEIEEAEIIPAIPAIIGLAGVTVSIRMTGVIEIPAAPATIGLSGVNATINLSGQIQIQAKAATIALDGVRASVNGNIRIGSIPAEIRLSGVPFSLTEKILARPAVIGLQGVAASIRYYGPIIIASSPAIIGLRGVNARIKMGYEPDMSIEQKIWLALKSRIETL